MREIIARIVCGLTIGVVLALSWWFALRHNPPPRAHASAEGERALRNELGPRAARGRGVYDALECASCHAIGGRGNPRHPLDGIGARLRGDELRRRVTATGDSAAGLAGSVVRRKAKYREIPDDEMAALIEYLSSLGAPK